jgi:hypothetical protein
MKPASSIVALILAIPFISSCAISAEEGEVNALVETFGSRLQDVSLNSPAVADEMKAQYGDLVDPSLLEQWMRLPSMAPGRTVSSPWPERIEISVVEEVSPDVYSVSGYLIEMSSYEVTHGGAAARIPVVITIGKLQKRWLITGYQESQE